MNDFKRTAQKLVVRARCDRFHEVSPVASQARATIREVRTVEPLKRFHYRMLERCSN